METLKFGLNTNSSGKENYEAMRHLIMNLFILIMLIPVCSWAGDVTGPRMVIEEPTFDAGKVDQGTVLDHSFIVKNTGDEELQITKVDPG